MSSLAKIPILTDLLYKACKAIDDNGHIGVCPPDVQHWWKKRKDALAAEIKKQKEAEETRRKNEERKRKTEENRRKRLLEKALKKLTSEEVLAIIEMGMQE